MENHKNIKKEPSDIRYDEKLQQVIDRFKMLLKPKSDPVCYFPNEAENLPEVMEVMEKLIKNELGISFPDVPGVQRLIDQVARDFGKWMKTERPDVFSGIIKGLNLGMNYPSKDRTIYEKLKSEGNNLFSQCKFKEAIVKYSEALMIEILNENEKAILYTNIASAFFEMNEISPDHIFLNESKKNVKKAINLNKNYLKSFYRLGKIYEKRDKLDKALLNYEKCIFLSPNNEEIKNLVASLKLKLFDRNRL